MNKALVSFTHGLGDLIQLTPCLRQLNKNGYMVDLMCRKEAITSGLFDECPYTDKLIEIGNPWKAEDFQKQIFDNHEKFVKIANKYDWIGSSLHLTQLPKEHKIDMTARELGLKLDDRYVEVFISEEDDAETKRYVESNFPDGYILRHTDIEFHVEHSWDCSDWIMDELPRLPVVDTGRWGDFARKWDSIGRTFSLLKYAAHRVLSSSVMVHASDALNAPVEVINYGKEDRKVWPVNNIAKRIRECGNWIK
jgi:hypothetical protein